ncbi:four helix bundle protein [Candidatus Parcubacteria bacterium]|nr:four helix bundle protein [Candidatus Parcubacteria bacterium]
MQFHKYEDLDVWRKSMDLVELVYRITKTFPKEELYGLTSQMRRCAVSIPSNIAEGSRRSTDKDFSHFVSIAFGSGAELETQIKIARRLKYTTDDESIANLLNDIMKMLNKLIHSLRNDG